MCTILFQRYFVKLCTQQLLIKQKADQPRRQIFFRNYLWLIFIFSFVIYTIRLVHDLNSNVTLRCKTTNTTVEVGSDITIGKVQTILWNSVPHQESSVVRARSEITQRMPHGPIVFAPRCLDNAAKARVICKALSYVITLHVISISSFNGQFHYLVKNIRRKEHKYLGAGCTTAF